MNISKNKKMRFFLMSQGSFNPKNQVPMPKSCPVARVQTDRRTHLQVLLQPLHLLGDPARVPVSPDFRVDGDEVYRSHVETGGWWYWRMSVANICVIHQQ